MFCQLDLLFFHVLVAVAVVVCLRSLIMVVNTKQEISRAEQRPLTGFVQLAPLLRSLSLKCTVKSPNFLYSENRGNLRQIIYISIRNRDGSTLLITSQVDPCESCRFVNIEHPNLTLTSTDRLPATDDFTNDESSRPVRIVSFRQH